MNLWVKHILFVVLFLVSVIFLSQKLAKTKIVEVKVETPVSATININHTFNLNGVEYTKRTLNNITITSYNNHANQTDDTPNITATNRPVREGIVAVSPDLISKGYIKFGDLLYIDCMNKWYIVEDSMNQRFERRIDIFLYDKSESLKIHKKCAIEIIHINK